MTKTPYKKCVHCGKCLSSCPSYRFFLKESFSPRGRNLLIAKNIDSYSFNYCLLCERCSKVCPQGISFPESYIKAKFSKGSFVLHPSDSLIFLKVLPFNQIQIRELDEKKLSPYFKEGDFYVYLSCGLKHLYPEALELTLSKIRHSPMKPHIPEGQGCCGIVFLGLGAKEVVKNYAKKLLTLFSEKKTLLTFCATCLWMIKRVYPQLFDVEQEKAAFEDLANRTYFVIEFLRKMDYSLNLKEKDDILYHLPCHLDFSLTSELNLLKGRIEDFCCGSAKLTLWLRGFQREFSKHWRRRILDKEVLATACTGCYLNFSSQLRYPPKVKHWLELWV
ncbi:MAG: (Fe-S)-binding protein [Caldimicrobium sp.]|nr:(Fe-S)-binding protein [Caldimicrobium sp.]